MAAPGRKLQISPKERQRSVEQYPLRPSHSAQAPRHSERSPARCVETSTKNAVAQRFDPQNGSSNRAALYGFYQYFRRNPKIGQNFYVFDRGILLPAPSRK